MTDNDEPPLEIREAWHLQPGRVYLVTVNRPVLTPEEAEHVRQVFGLAGITVIVAPQGLLTLTEQP